MSDLPKFVEICEKGPREGLQIEPGPIATDRKIALIDALSETGVRQIQVCSFVNPKKVPGWADADDVVTGMRVREGVSYLPLWLNERGLMRALQYRNRLTFKDAILLSASERFIERNQNQNTEKNIAIQNRQVEVFLENGLAVDGVLIMAAFGCNFAGDIPTEHLVATVAKAIEIAEAHQCTLTRVSLNDTMAWATPDTVKRTVGAIRERWPSLRINLHFHNTRGLGLANVYAGLEMGVDSYDSSVAGLGGCPFAGHQGAAGNVCTEDVVFLCEELGVETGIDLERMIEAARLAEDIVGHPLPGSIMKGGSLARLRSAIR
ncbi:hydroxymethylglutaryl-CoA lyase [Propylenella binzhouense]|uniref:Hydroxymethylglutaryl-CoA lyase n=1 Tax=Propylenella binzhouense TaxID=2555902 RepID=A0A964T1L6_9HYPH|nr:hydroxymethylglutaryl-CoA lyase [Propylenella binzhouense]MYZ46584.1 hydroxymethylglutaryl-CoA lyase [Propylenella binzhouense]